MNVVVCAMYSQNKCVSYLRLLNAKMSVDTGVSCSASQVLVLSVRYVEFSTCVSVLLGQAKVDDEQLRGGGGGGGGRRES